LEKQYEAIIKFLYKNNLKLKKEFFIEATILIITIIINCYDSTNHLQIFGQRINEIKCRININGFFKYISLKVSSDCWLHARTVEDFVERTWLMFARYRGVSRDCCCHLNCSITRITCRVTLSSSKRACRTWILYRDHDFCR